MQMDGDGEYRPVSRQGEASAHLVEFVEAAGPSAVMGKCELALALCDRLDHAGEDADARKEIMLAFRDAWRETAGISLSPEQEQDVVHFAYLSRVLFNSRIGQTIPLYINWLATPCDSSGESVVRLGKEFRFHIPARCSIFPEIWGSPYVGMLVTGEGSRGLFEGAVNPAADGSSPETAAVLLSPAQRFFCEDISINDGVTRFELVALDD